MKCYDDSELQSYLDREVSFRERQDIEQHLEHCDICRANLITLEENKDFAGGFLGLLNEEASRLQIPVKPGWAKFNLSHGRRLHSQPPPKGVLMMTRNFKKWTIVAAAALCIGLSFTSSTVRAAAADFLTLFRAEKLQAISFDPQQLRDMGRVFREKGITFKADNFGKLTNKGVEPPSEMTVAEAAKLADFTIRTPAFLPYEYNRVTTSFSKSGTIELELKVQNVNQLIKSLGGSTYLPEELDNQTFYLRVPNALFTNYGAVDEMGKTTHRLSVTQFISPEIVAPDRVNVNQMRQAILALPVLPEDIRRQLASIEDWQKTMVIPTVQGQTKEVTIDGHTALYTVPQTDRNWSEYGLLTWQSGGVITIIEGDLSQEQLIKVAENLR